MSQANSNMQQKCSQFSLYLLLLIFHHFVNGEATPGVIMCYMLSSVLLSQCFSSYDYGRSNFGVDLSNDTILGRMSSRRIYIQFLHQTG